MTVTFPPRRGARKAVCRGRNPTGRGWFRWISPTVARAVLARSEQVIAQRTAARVAEESGAAGFGAGRLSALLTGGWRALRLWFQRAWCCLRWCSSRWPLARARQLLSAGGPPDDGGDSDGNDGVHRQRQVKLLGCTWVLGPWGLDRSSS